MAQGNSKGEESFFARILNSYDNRIQVTIIVIKVYTQVYTTINQVQYLVSFVQALSIHIVIQLITFVVVLMYLIDIFKVN